MTKFNPGRFVTTRAVFDEMAKGLPFRKFVAGSVARHLAGDWGDLPAADKKMNEAALKGGSRLLSAYIYKDEKGENPRLKVWVVTEADRSSTTVLFPSDY